MAEEFEFAVVRDEETLSLSIDGWEGPLDLLLSLARQQKVDLHQISILALVEQYLAYIEGARSQGSHRRPIARGAGDAPAAEAAAARRHA